MKMVLPSVMQNEKNQRHDIFVNTIEKISREFPEILLERQIFMKLLAFVKVLTGSMRAAIFKSFEKYLFVCKRKMTIEDINEITLSLFADFDDILSDISNENQQAFLQLVLSIAKLNTDNGDKLLEKIM